MTVSAYSTAPIEQRQSPIEVLVVDDSVVVRTVMERILNENAGFAVVQKASNAEMALAFLDRQKVDLILLDIELPGQSGIAVLPQILTMRPDAKVVVLSGKCEEGSAAAVEALALGASDILSKPGSGSFGEQFPAELIARLTRLFGDRSLPAIRSDTRKPAVPTPAAEPLECLGIGASTGGIHALSQLFDGLKTPLAVPVLLTQHLPASFTVYFAQQLARMTEMRVKVAQTGDLLKPGTLYVAPGDANLQVRRGLHGRVHVALNAQRTPSGNLPGVDPMFSSMAEAYGAGAAGIVLTGMGRDGTAGARDIVTSGGWVVAQDEASSVVWGMPGSVAGAGLTCAIMEPGAMMSYIIQRGRMTA